jgi:tRNA-dihydrouridine synthase 1
MTPESNKKLLAYTPMLHARMFTETPKFRDCHFQPSRSSLAEKPTADAHKAAALYLDGNPAIDRPLFVQFCANNPDELLEAAEYVAPFCDAVDLNLGCPQGIARKGKYGAFLQEDQELIYSLIKKLHDNLSVPVTAKIRILETREKTLEYAQKVLSAGASILTVHGRHRDQKGHNTGVADWNIIRYLRESLPKETVIFANGNILRREDIDRCLEVTGADAVMSAEGNLYDPAIFAEAPEIGEEGRDYWRGKDGKGGYRMDAALRRYLDIIYKYVLEVPVPARKPLFITSDPIEEPTEVEEQQPDEERQPPRKRRRADKKEKTTNPNLLAMQPHCFHLLRSLVTKHHSIRDALSKCRSGDVAAFENVLKMVEVVMKDALIEYESTDGKSMEEYLSSDERPKTTDTVLLSPEDNEEYQSSVRTVKECKRPWWVCQPYVRPLPSEAFQKGSLTLSKKDLAKLPEEERKKIQDIENAKSIPETVPVKTTVHVGKEVVNGNSEENIEIPKEGLVCG